jgi:hypothetical protein
MEQKEEEFELVFVLLLQWHDAIEAALAWMDEQRYTQISRAS